MDTLIDFTEIDADGEIWEMFTRDFLQELGFFIESVPDRGADGGKDLLVTEQLKGTLNNYRFRWLVSCKHYAHSKKSVIEKDEINLQERLDSFNADGFMGFYSTLPSSGLNNRLNALKTNGKIKDYRVFDHKLIENYLIRIGFSKLLMRYLPSSYKKVKPIHLIIDEFIPLECAHCGKELIEALQDEYYSGAIICDVIDREDYNKTIDMYWACKGKCDRLLRDKYLHNYNGTTRWQDLRDLMIPSIFLEWIFTRMDQLREKTQYLTDEAFKKEKYIMMAMSQKVFREMTEDEQKRVKEILSMPFL